MHIETLDKAKKGDYLLIVAAIPRPFMESYMDTPNFLTIKQFVEKQPAFSAGGVRSLIFYRGDDAEKAGAIARLGRRILINEGVFLAWVQGGGARQIRGAA